MANNGIPALTKRTYRRPSHSLRPTDFPSYSAASGDNQELKFPIYNCICVLCLTVHTGAIIRNGTTSTASMTSCTKYTTAFCHGSTLQARDFGRWSSQDSFPARPDTDAVHWDRSWPSARILVSPDPLTITRCLHLPSHAYAGSRQVLSADRQSVTL